MSQHVRSILKADGIPGLWYGAFAVCGLGLLTVAASWRCFTHSMRVRRVCAHRGCTGTSTTMTRAIILGATKLASYDEAKQILHDQFGLSRTGVPAILGASVTAGLLVALCTAPADFCRTRVMTARQLAAQTGVEVQYV